VLNASTEHYGNRVAPLYTKYQGTVVHKQNFNVCSLADVPLQNHYAEEHGWNSDLKFSYSAQICLEGFEILKPRVIFMTNH
jgi:hypothetical protein